MMLAVGLVASGCVADSNEGSDGASGNPASEETVEDAETISDSIGASAEPEYDVNAERDFGAADPLFAALPLEEQIDTFLAEPNSDRGAIVAWGMGQTGEARWAPWLLDIFRLGRSTRIDTAAVQSLTTLSGLASQGHRTDDYRTYGNWVYDTRPDPGPGYDRWKQQLYGSIDPEFAELLAQVDDRQLLAEIQWGGVGRGGIPELNNPDRLTVQEAEWVTDDELILGVTVNGEAVAYPVRILGHHELANDVVGGLDVAMVYCTLCRSGLLFEREVDGQLLNFQTSGLLVESNKIMVDNETDTLWRHQTGVGLAGALVDAELVQHPVLTTTWAEWVETHPDTEVVDIPDPIFFENPEQPPIAYEYDAGGAYRFYYEDPDTWFPIFDTPDTFELKDSIIGLTFDGAHLAVGVDALIDEGPHVFEIGSSQILLVPTNGGARGFDVSGLGISTGSWSVSDGDVSDDEVTLTNGESAPRVVVPQLFWFAWYGQHTETKTWPS